MQNNSETPKLIKYKKSFNEFLLLKKGGDKTQGKNRNPYDGYYSIAETYTSDFNVNQQFQEEKVDYSEKKDEEYFIKCPEGEKGRIEFFTEYFAGQLCEKLAKDKFIPARYKDCFIAADLGETISETNKKHEKYVLVQPNIAVRHDLFRVFGPQIEVSGVKMYDLYDTKKRNSLVNYFFGGNEYRSLAGYLLTAEEWKNSTDSLPFILMLSIAVLGDYSVHDANVFHYCPDDLNIFARYDFGAAFRYFNNKGNNKNIFIPREYRRVCSCYKFLTKNYLRYYITYIPDCLEQMKNHAQALHEAFQNDKDDRLKKSIAEVIRGIPDHMLSAKEVNNIANYIEMPTFKDIFSNVNVQNKKESINKFSNELANVIKQRVAQLAQVQVPGFFSRVFHFKYHFESWILYWACAGVLLYLLYAHTGAVVLSILTLTLISVTVNVMSSLFFLYLSLKCSRIFSLFYLLVFIPVIASIGATIYFLILPVYPSFFVNNNTHHSRLLLFITAAFGLFFLFEVFIRACEHSRCNNPRLYGNLFRALSIATLLGVSEYGLYGYSSHYLSVSPWAFGGYFFLAVAMAIMSNRCLIFPLNDNVDIYFLYHMVKNKGDKSFTSGRTPQVPNLDNANVTPTQDDANKKTSLLSPLRY